MFGLLSAEIYKPKPHPDDSFREPTDGSLRYSPWGAVPANPYIDERLRLRQRFIDIEFRKLFDKPPEGTPAGFAQMLAADHSIGEERRKMKNFEGFMEWTAQKQPVTLDLDAKISHIERGSAYAGDTFDFALETKVLNFEVGKVTHPYGVRLEHVDPFRKEVEDAIEERGGKVYPKVLAYHSIAIVPDIHYGEDGTHQLNGFIVRYKRDFGAIDMLDGSGRIHIIERQIAGIRVDAESGFDQAIVKRMLDYDISPQRSWQKRYVNYIVDTGARGFIERAIQQDTTETFFVPDSTTIYGFKEKFETSKALGSAAFASPVQVGDIAYFGPDHYAPSKVPIESLTIPS